MDDIEYNRIKKEYISFKERIEKEIKDNKHSYHFYDYYLINDSWIKQLNINFIEYENKKNTNCDNNILFYLPNEQPEIINDKLSAINCFKNGLNLELVSKKFFNLIFDKEFLRYCNEISYMAGYNKIIIEYKEISDKNRPFKNCLLLINPFQLIDNNYKSYILGFKNDSSINIYKTILENKININYQYIRNINNYNIVDETFDEYINNNNYSSLFDNFNKNMECETASDKNPIEEVSFNSICIENEKQIEQNNLNITKNILLKK